MLRLEAVHSYYEKSHVLQGVSLEIGKGEPRLLAGAQRRGQIDHHAHHHGAERTAQRPDFL